MVAAMCGLAACRAAPAPAVAVAESASPSAVPSPSASCVPYPDVDDPLAGRSSFVRKDGLDTLVIAAGPPLCSDRPLYLSMAYITFGSPGSRAVRSGQHELIGPYDGSQALRIPFPILGSPCLGAAVYLGDGDIGDRQLPSTDWTGVESGPRLYKTSLLTFDPQKPGFTWGLLAVDAAAGKKCGSALRPAK
ncbi:hypothetical protein [Actinoplanes subtropicus]|uniref:hypothetical protein n=1 Tax=Actinoplanes subtropicus TaxID=543632 RepID=UPI0012F90B7E|nr:hypothetical protein [Actinoplanes subtropicus]